MTILFSLFLTCVFFFFFLYDDIGRGQLNMQLNKSDDGGDEDDDGGEEEEEEEEDRGGVTDHRAFSRCSDGFCYFLIIERLFRRTAQTGQSQEVKTEGEGGT